MTDTTSMSSHEFDQKVSAAKRASNKGPVLITDQGQPTHVLMSFEDYQRLTKPRRNIVDALAMLGAADIEFDPPRATIGTRSATRT